LDIIKPFAAIVDMEMTRGGWRPGKSDGLVDNEWGFTNQMIRQIQAL
jgi:hypothetical protein